MFRYFFYDRQVIFSPAFLPGRGWQTPQQLLKDRKRHGKRLRVPFTQSNFSCLRRFAICFSLGPYIFKAVFQRRENVLWSPYFVVIPEKKTGIRTDYSLKRGAASGHKRTNLTTCAMRVFPRSQDKSCLHDFSGARTKNQLQFLYTTIYCEHQGEVSIFSAT